jgi:hypothetical protein
MIKQPKVICRIKGSYTNKSGDETRYEYRVFETDTMAEFIRLRDYELKRHPNAKQEVIWEE